MSSKWAKKQDGPLEPSKPEEADAKTATGAGAGPVDPAAATAADSDTAESGATDPSATDPVAVLEAENSELRDQLLRALAETENVRRRSQREKEDIGRFAVSNLARDMLTVADNLHRVIEAIPEDTLKEDHALNSLYEGDERIGRDLQQVFERHGITRITPLGEKFDHNLHQAMFEIDDPDAEPGTVVQLMAPGYLIHGRLLRPAMVGVAKGGQKKEADAANGDNGDDAAAETAEAGDDRQNGDGGRQSQNRQSQDGQKPSGIYHHL